MDEKDGAIEVEILAAQIKKAEELSDAMKRDRFEHVGAEKAFMLIANQMPELARNFDDRVSSDSSVEDVQVVRKYVHNLISHIKGLCESSALKQRNEVLICEGRAQSAQMMADGMRRDISNIERNRVANEARIAKREEVIFEREQPVIDAVDPPMSKGGRVVERPPQERAVVKVLSSEERKAQSEATKRAAKAAKRAAAMRAQGAKRAAARSKSAEDIGGSNGVEDT